MKKFLFIKVILIQTLWMVAFCAKAQGGSSNVGLHPRNFPKENNPDNTNFELYSQKDGKSRRSDLVDLKEYFVPDAGVNVGYVPVSSGNVNHRMMFVTDPNGAIWYIDAAGDAIQVGGTTKMWQYRTVTTTNGSAVFTVSGTIPVDLATVEVERNGIIYKTGPPGCTECGVVYSSVNNNFVFYRAISPGEKIMVKVFN